MRFLVLYASETGTAQDVAEQLWRSSKKYGFKGPVLPMDEYPTQKMIDETLIIFVVATTGDGDEPENMRSTWKFLLRRSLPPSSLEKLQYACLGLGDSSYAKFNYAAKRLNKRLQQLGAKQIIPLGLCDDQHDHGFGATALPWMSQLWLQLQQRLGVSATNDDLKSDAMIFKWNCKISHDKLENIDTILWPGTNKAEKLILQQNVRTTDPQHFQDVRLLEFQCPVECQWSPGDVLQVQPRNSEQQVNAFFAWAKEHQLELSPDMIVEVTSCYEDMPVPKCYSKPLSVRQMATYVWDLNFKPRQRAFELLAIKCEDELEKEKLLEFTTAEGLDSLITYVNRPRRTILEVLQDFRQASAKLTLEILIELFTFIQPRSFSIASCRESGKLDLLVAVVEYKTILSKPRLGLCSNWLKCLELGSEIYGCIKHGTMKLPQDNTAPIIMVGPGTGIAPFRSVLQSRHYESKDNAVPQPLIVVYFGCRNKAKDYHFQEDLERWHNESFITLHCAFSRDQDDKVYVQHLIEQSSEQLRPVLIQNNSVILVAGSSKNMPRSVREAFVKVLNGQEEIIENMIKTKRYQEETWS